MQRLPIHAMQPNLVLMLLEVLVIRCATSIVVAEALSARQFPNPAP
jgi:hypothetical protein